MRVSINLTFLRRLCEEKYCTFSSENDMICTNDFQYERIGEVWAVQVNISEALRYLGAGADAATEALVRDAAAELERRVQPRFVYRVLPVTMTEAGASLPGLLLPGDMARRMLREAKQAAILVCTLGAGFEALLRASEARDMAHAVALDASGSAFVETGCDAAESEIAARFPGMYLTDRFSPGYGDLPLAVQPELLRLTDAERRLGVTLTESLLMVPSKSVTAVVGICDTPQPARIRGCAFCNLKQTCAFRKRGTTCGAS